MTDDRFKALREARWYCLDRDGVAMLCKDESDARAQVSENDDCWPGRAPHRAALLVDVEDAERLRRELRDTATEALMKTQGVTMLTEKELLDIVDALIRDRAFNRPAAVAIAMAVGAAVEAEVRRRCALRVALHSQYPIETDFDRGYAQARKDAAETLRMMGAEHEHG